MNYYPPMNHQHMPQAAPFQFPPADFTNVSNTTTNRFIYVKHNFLHPAPKVLVNPHFRKKVYVNPQFNPPKIHINPNFVNVPKVEPKAVTPPAVISTRNKLVRIPVNSEKVRKRRDSVHTKYKIVRSGAKNSPINNKFKLDKRDKSVKVVKKKYVYVNRFLSIEVMAKNVLLKKNSKLRKPGFVNINGILYKKSPNSLKKASDSTKLKKTDYSLFKSSSKYKIVRKDTNASTNRKTVIKRFKIIRSKKSTGGTPSKMRTCNIPCPIFRKYGKCPRKTAGTCFKLHNPDQIILCTRFLQGACRNEKCLLSHKVSLEKMPTCKYFLDGLCSKDNCPYLHVKISPKAEICRDFLEGFCKKGAQCAKRHQFLCPDFEKNKKCPKRRCPYPHGNTVRKSKVLNTLAKKCSVKKKKIETSELVESNRYYKDSSKESLAKSVKEESVIQTVSRDRPQLGSLPSFIPLNEGT